MTTDFSLSLFYFIFFEIERTDNFEFNTNVCAQVKTMVEISPKLSHIAILAQIFHIYVSLSVRLRAFSLADQLF